MAQSCDYLLASDINATCDDLVVAGVERVAVLINRADIKTSAVTYTNDNTISALPLNTGKKGYKVQQIGTKPFEGTKVEMSSGTYINGFNNTLQFYIPSNSADTSAILDILANGEFVAVFENKFKNAENGEGNGAFQVFGIKKGLRTSAMENEKWNDDTRNGWLITMVEENAPNSGVFLYNTDYTTTQKAFESLTTIAE